MAVRFMVGIIIGQFDILATPQTDILRVGGILIVVLLVAGFVLLFLRKRWDPRHANRRESGQTVLEQIEAMHKAGHISDEEFSAIRRRLLKIPSGKEESKSNFSRSDSIMDDSERIRQPGQEGPDTTDDL
jgi:uncharacterized membrane protein